MRDPRDPRRLGVRTGAMLVAGSMIGTGVFTTTGFLVHDLGSPLAVLLVWLVGGGLAFFGATSYAELGAALPENGGEYHLLSRIYHPSVGFIAGWTSLIVGFAAPTAACAIAFGRYLSRTLPDAPALPLAIGLLLALTALHAAKVEVGARWQDVFTLLKLVLIGAFVAGGISAGHLSNLFPPDAPPLGPSVLSPIFAVSLIYVSFAYSGWSAAAYVAGELEAPGKTLPRALLLGTGVVTLLYTGLNLVFLSSAPRSALSGVLEVGHVSAVALFGQAAGNLLSLLIALGLVSTTGALIMTGSRVVEAMGRDYPALAGLGSRQHGRGPRAALVIQSTIALIMTVSATFDTLLTYIGVTLSLSTLLTVLGVLVLRRREPELPRPYRAFGYPWAPLCFVLMTAWVIVQAVIDRPLVAAAGAGTVVAGGLVWVLVGRGRPPAR